MQILKLLTIISIISLLQACFIFSNEKVILEISPIKSQLNAADDLVFYVTTKNNSDKAIVYYKPSLHGGKLKIDLKTDGKISNEARTYCGAPPPRSILEANSEASDLFDLGDFRGAALESGNYTLNVESIIDNSIKISSNTIYFEVEQLTEKEESVKAAYLLLYRRSNLDTNYAHQILTQYPNTIFKNKIHQLIAQHYSYKHEYKKSIFEYNKVLESIDDIHYRDKILSSLAYDYEKNGNLNLAISTLEKSFNPDNYRLLSLKYELEWNKKNQ